MNEELKLVDSTCKFCQTPLEYRFIDIMIPAQGDQIKRTEDQGMDRNFLLPTYVCAHCFLVQVDESYLPPIPKRAFVSSFGFNWLNDIKKFTDNIFEYFETTDQQLKVTLIHRNNESSRKERDSSFNFGMNGLHALIDMYGKADSIECHDELTYVHDINDFVYGLKLFLKPNGVISMEFLHLLPILESEPIQSKPLERFPYLSLTTVDKILKAHGLVVFDIGHTALQGGLAILIKHAEDRTRHISSKVTSLRGRERCLGMSSLQCYRSYVDHSQNSLPVREELSFLSGY